MVQSTIHDIPYEYTKRTPGTITFKEVKILIVLSSGIPSGATRAHHLPVSLPPLHPPVVRDFRNSVGSAWDCLGPDKFLRSVSPTQHFRIIPTVLVLSH